MEKVLLRFDETSFNSAMNRLYSAQGELQRVVDQINKIGSFQVDQTALADIVSARGDSTANRIEAITKAELDRVGIRSESIIKGAVTGDLEKYYLIINAYKRPDSDLVSYLSLDDKGKVTFPEKAKEKLREEHSYYVQTEKGLEIYNAHKNMIDAINAFIETCPQINGATLKGFIGISYGEKQVCLTQVGYDRIAALS